MTKGKTRASDSSGYKPPPSVATQLLGEFNMTVKKPWMKRRLPAFSKELKENNALNIKPKKPLWESKRQKVSTIPL